MFDADAPIPTFPSRQHIRLKKMNVPKTLIASMLPRRVRRVISPWYRRLTGRAVKIAIGSFGGFEIAHRMNTADEGTIRHSLSFLSSVPEYQPNEGDVIIDIGAHIGTFSLLAASKVGRAGKVHAIEASNESFALLRINAALNRSNNILLYHLAIFDKEGTCTLYHNSRNSGHSMVKRLSRWKETVEACSLSAFLTNNRIDRCHFMKLNCEGAEFPILLSAPREVLRRVDVILVLYHCDLWRRNTEDDLLCHLDSCGFSCATRNRTNKRGWIIATLNQLDRCHTE